MRKSKCIYVVREANVLSTHPLAGWGRGSETRRGAGK